MHNFIYLFKRDTKAKNREIRSITIYLKANIIMVLFNGWCNFADQNIGVHNLRIITAIPENLNIGMNAASAIVRSHYVSEENLARVYRSLGKTAAANLIETKLPTSKQIRSGDLGEIFATEYIVSATNYIVPIKRLRWRDHRNMAMRGDDVIGFHQNPQTGKLTFLKAESKSRATLSAGVIDQAREGLNRDKGLPSAHALTFITDILIGMSRFDLADAINKALLKDGIQEQDVNHLVFTMSGNDPQPYLSTSLTNYTGTISQWGVGMQIAGHGDFISKTYELVMANANS